jgi:hypothetical protein
VTSPNSIEHDRWRLAVEDGRCSLATWGEQARAFGWTGRDQFGLHKPPEDPPPDATGMIWLLEGRQVIAATEDTAAIRGPSGSVTAFRKNRKPALGPIGDSLDDFQ